MCVTVINLIATFQSRADDTRLHLSDLSLLLISFYFFKILLKVTKLSRWVAVMGALPSLASFHVLHWLFFAAPESSNAPVVSGLSVRWRLFSSARPLLVFSATAWQIKAAPSKRLPALLPSKGKAESSLGLAGSQGVSAGTRAALTHVTAIESSKDRLFYSNYRIFPF